MRDDRGEGVVDVMGHPAGGAAEGGEGTGRRARRRARGVAGRGTRHEAPCRLHFELRRNARRVRCVSEPQQPLRVQPGDEPRGPVTGQALEHYSTDASEVVGRLLDGRYLVESVLGQGAMAVVLGARHVFLGKRVAIKVLHPKLVAIDEMKARFLREARATSGIQHDAVVTVTDFGVSPGGLHYLVMEHLEGEDLLSWSHRRGMATAHEAATIGAGICEALAAIHAAGYVHRDLKPENVWIGAGPNGDGMSVKVLDLGIAALLDEDEPPSEDARAPQSGRRLTRAGQTLGTVLYMSPEQSLGNRVDGRSDLYALGCILWELVCDACTFDGTSQMDIMLKQVATTPDPPSSRNPAVPPWFDAVVMRCLAKRPDDRYESAAALLTILRARLADHDAQPRAMAPTGEIAALTPPEVPGPRRRVWPFALGLSAVVAVALIATTLGSDAGPSQASAPLVVIAPTPIATTMPATPPAPSTAPAPTLTASAGPTAAPAPTPDAPTSAKATPAEIAVTFDVAPRGSEIRRDGALVATSPAVVKLPLADTPIRFELSHAGRVAESVEVVPRSDVQVTRSLAQARARTNATASPPPTETARPPGDAPPHPTGDELWRPERPPGIGPDAGGSKGSNP
ncbi:MAG: protein kinase [Myxococcota bacterium]